MDFEKEELEFNVEKETKTLNRLLNAQNTIGKDLKNFLKREIKIFEKIFDTEYEKYKENIKKQLFEAYNEVIKEKDLKKLIRGVIANEILNSIEHFKKEVIKSIYLDKTFDNMTGSMKKEQIKLIEKTLKEKNRFSFFKTLLANIIITAAILIINEKFSLTEILLNHF